VLRKNRHIEALSTPDTQPQAIPLEVPALQLVLMPVATADGL
jgi:hypothetical protein